MTADFVSADGSPLPIYLALPAGDEPLVIHDACPGGSILELGSGPGRITRVLVALGHEVVAIDDSAEMLAHVTGAERVCANVRDVDLQREFDVVVAASCLINDPDRQRRRALLDVCRRHVRASGSVLIERHPPGWLLDAETTHGTAGPVGMTFTPVDRDGSVTTATMTYRLGGTTWEQRFTAADVDDATLADDAEAVGLGVVGSIDDERTWVRLSATTGIGH